jgi:hypothetical protein
MFARSEQGWYFDRGCTHYLSGLRLLSLGSLSHVRWLQIAVLLNPIVSMSEGLRAAPTPDVPICHP